MLLNILRQRCPRCRKGKLFTHAAYSPGNFAKMHKNCDCCGLRYELEPSFFYGAMYVSYAFQVALLITVFTGFQLIAPDAAISWYIGVFLVVLAILFPVNFRLSKSIWIHFFVKYKPGYATCDKKSPGL